MTLGEFQEQVTDEIEKHPRFLEFRKVIANYRADRAAHTMFQIMIENCDLPPVDVADIIVLGALTAHYGLIHGSKKETRH